MTIYKAPVLQFGANTYHDEFRLYEGKVLKVQCFRVINPDRTWTEGEKLEAAWDPDDPEIPEHVRRRIGFARQENENN